MKRWKHLLVVGLTICSAMAFIPNLIVQAQDSVTVSVDAPAEVAQGTDFIARVDVNQVTNFDGANYDVTYDPAILEVTNASNGLIAGTTIPVDMWGVISPGRVRMIQNVPGLSGVSGSGYLAEIHFHVLGSASSTSSIGLSNGVLADNAANEIPAAWVGDSVHINTVLDADFSVTAQQGIAGVTQFVFDDSSTGGTPPYTFSWDFDNNGTVDSTAASPSYIYASAGNYTVTLIVTDSSLAATSNTESKTSYIAVFAPLDADFSTNALEGVAGRTAFAFSDQTTGGKTPYTYQWSFGDGGTSTSANPTHSYASAGTYTVTLSVTESLSTISTETKTSYIKVYKSGDANKDGNVNSLDITKVERIIMALDNQTVGADANGDGNVNALDITRIELTIMGS